MNTVMWYLLMRIILTVFKHLFVFSCVQLTDISLGINVYNLQSSPAKNYADMGAFLNTVFAARSFDSKAVTLHVQDSDQTVGVG